MRAGDLEAIRATLADDIELYSPVFAESFVGRAQVEALFGVLLEAFESVDEGVSGDRFVLAFRPEVGGHRSKSSTCSRSTTTAGSRRSP